MPCQIVIKIADHLIQGDWKPGRFVEIVDTRQIILDQLYAVIPEPAEGSFNNIGNGRVDILIEWRPRNAEAKSLKLGGPDSYLASGNNPVEACSIRDRTGHWAGRVTRMGDRYNTCL